MCRATLTPFYYEFVEANTTSGQYCKIISERIYYLPRWTVRCWKKQSRSYLFLASRTQGERGGVVGSENNLTFLKSDRIWLTNVTPMDLIKIKKKKKFVKVKKKKKNQTWNTNHWTFLGFSFHSVKRIDWWLGWLQGHFPI